MKELKGKYLALGFENGDVMYISLDKVIWFNIDNITKNISYTKDYIHKMKQCEHFAAILHIDFLKESWIDFEFNNHDKKSDGTYEERLTKYLDIVDISIVNKKGSVVDSPIYVAWGEDEYTNEYERIGYDKHGHLYIEICSPKEPDHYKETIKNAQVKFIERNKDDSNSRT